MPIDRLGRPTGEDAIRARDRFEVLLIEAQRRYDAMTPEQQKAMRDAQRKSWVIGNYMLDHPKVTREEADEIYQKVVEGIGL